MTETPDYLREVKVKDVPLMLTTHNAHYRLEACQDTMPWDGLQLALTIKSSDCIRMNMETMNSVKQEHIAVWLKCEIMDQLKRMVRVLERSDANEIIGLGKQNPLQDYFDARNNPERDEDGRLEGVKYLDEGGEDDDE